MSIILDALKRAEAERKPIQDNTEPPSIVTRSVPAKRKIFPIILASALLVAATLGGGGLYFVGKKFLKRTAKTENLPPPPPVVKKDDSAEKAAKWRDEAASFLAAGNLAEARKRWEQIIKAAPDAEAHNNLGVILRKSGDDAAAEGSYLKALELKAEYPEALNNLGALYLARPESEDDALRLFKKAAGLNAQYAEPHFHLAVLLERRGLNRQAYEQYQQFLSLATSADKTLQQKINDKIKKLKAGE